MCKGQAGWAPSTALNFTSFLSSSQYYASHFHTKEMLLRVERCLSVRPGVGEKLTVLLGRWCCLLEMAW